MKFFKKTVLASFVGMFSMMSISAHAEQGKISDGVVRIGVLTDMSNVYALTGGSGAVVAARMALEDFGKKDIHGARIEILAADDQSRGDVAAEKTKTWIEKDKVDVVVGFVATSAALGSIKEASKHKVPVLVASATSTGLTNDNCTPYTVHWMQDTYGLSVGTVKSLIEQGKKSFYFVTADYAFGRALEKDATDLIKANGGEVKGSSLAPFPGADFSEQLAAAKASGAQVVAFANSGLDAVGTTSQAFKMQMNKTQTIAPLLLFHADVKLLGSNILQNQTMTIGYVWNQSQESKDFAKRYFSKTHRMPDVGQAGVYSAVLEYLRAVDELGTDDGDAVMGLFKNPEHKMNDAILKNAYVRADGRMVKPMYVIRIKAPNEMKHEWDFYDIKKELSAEESSIPLERSTCSFIKNSKAKEGALDSKSSNSVLKTEQKTK